MARGRARSSSSRARRNPNAGGGVYRAPFRPHTASYSHAQRMAIIGDGGPAAWTPNELADPLLWLRAKDLATITKDGSDIVSGWDDSFGTGFDLTQGTAGNRPTWSATALNGQPGVVFDGVDDFLRRDATFLNATDSFTIYCACRAVAAAEKRLIAEGSSTDGLPIFAPLMSRGGADTDQLTFLVRYNSMQVDKPGGPSAWDDLPTMVGSRFSASGGTVTVTQFDEWGDFGASYPYTPEAAAAPFDRFTLAAQTQLTGVADFLECTIGEMVIVGHAGDAVEFNQMVAYFVAEGYLPDLAYAFAWSDSTHFSDASAMYWSDM